MRFLFVVVVSLLIGCIPAKNPGARDHRALASNLKEKSVALVRLSYKVTLTSDSIKFEPETKPFCTAVWVSSNMLATANHCVDEMSKGDELAYVTSREFDPSSNLQKPRIAALVAADVDHDLALLKALSPPANHEVANLSERKIEEGDETHTMGHPLGLWFSFSTGEVAAIRKATLQADEDDPIKETLWIQTNADISSGNSGGGLFDEDGNLTGICSRTRRDGAGLHFYVHRDHVRSFLKAAKA
jgi:S1-C subfamily serine protease